MESGSNFVKFARFLSKSSLEICRANCIIYSLASDSIRQYKYRPEDEWARFLAMPEAVRAWGNKGKPVFLNHR